MKKCLMKHSAEETIIAASCAASGEGKETGGILIGPSPMDGYVAVTCATGSAPDDERASATSWETNPEDLNERLKAARAADPSVNLRGFWHLHPGQMTRPSVQDLCEARDILEDTEHYKLDELVMPIVTVDSDGVTIHCYRISRDDQYFREMPLEIIPDTDNLLEYLSSDRETAEIRMDAGGDFWQDGDWQFYASPYGAGRLEAELDGLENSGYEVTARLLNNGNCCIQVSGDGGSESALFLMPREFPLNPPQVFMKSGEDIREMAIYMPLRGWSSEMRLSELMGGELGEQLRKTPNDKTCEEG